MRIGFPVFFCVNEMRYLGIDGGIRNGTLLERRQDTRSSWMPGRVDFIAWAGLCRDGVRDTVPASGPMIVRFGLD